MTDTTNTANLTILPKLDFSPEDFSMPRWKITKAGLFCNTMTGEEKPNILGVVVKAARSRFLWPDEFEASNLPLCYSVNSYAPEVDTYAYAAKCADCPMSLWTGKEKPKCALSYDYLLYDTETEIPAVLSLSRSRIVTARALNSFFQTSGVKFILQFYTEIERSTKGLEYFQVKFNVLTKNPALAEYVNLMIENRGTPLCGLITAGEAQAGEEKPEVEF